MTQSKTDNTLDGRKILIVDDEPDALVFIATVLEDNGATVVKAEDGDEALDLAKKEKPDLMTLDLAMPGKSGVEVYEALRSDPELKTLPVCIITGRPEMRKLIYERTTIPAPEGYLNKPVMGKSLVTNIRKILELRDRQRARHQGD